MYHRSCTFNIVIKKYIKPRNIKLFSPHFFLNPCIIYASFVFKRKINLTNM